MNDNEPSVLPFPKLNSQGEPVSAILVPIDMRDTIVIGFRGDGSFYWTAEGDDPAQIILMLEMTKKRLLEELDGGGQADGFDPDDAA